MTTPTDAGSAELVARLRIFARIGGMPSLYRNPDGPEAADRILALETRLRELEEASDPNVPGDILCKIISHDEMHETAVELGYPSVLEALEDLALKAQDPNP